MPATPADIARFTTDGVLISTNEAEGNLVLAAHPNARRTEDGQEIEMFFVDPAHAQVLLNERFGILKVGGGLHDGVEVEESIDLGTAIPIWPVVPSFTVTDGDGRVIAARTSGFARNMRIDRYAVEVEQ